MRLHQADKKADWQKIRHEKRNIWQRTAEFSKGFITPGNLVSLVGLGLVIYGAYLLLQGNYFIGLIVVLGGRLADILDGLVAERTRTKSPLGEAMDALIDKLAILVLIPVLVIENLIPLLVLGIILAQNGCNAVLALTAKSKKIILRPSIEGKIATAASWASVAAFSALAIAGQGSHPAIHLPLSILAYSSIIIFILYGARASRSYARQVFSNTWRDYFLKLRGRTRTRPNFLQEFKHIILIVNPQSSNVQRMEKRSRELRHLFPDIPLKFIETTPQPSQMFTKLGKELRGQTGYTLVGIGGGDGTVNAAINALMNLQSEVDLSNTLILPLWGGNANDLATMLNGLPTRTSMRSLLVQAEVIAIYPLQISIRTKNKPKTVKYAACYASFGATAYVAAEIERPSHREEVRNSTALGTFLKELKQVGRAILDAPSFDVEQNGERVKIFEHAFFNGTRMAKLDRFPVKLHEKKFFRVVKSDKPPTLLFYLRQVLMGKKHGEITNQPFQFTTKERAWAQFDGEAMVLPKNTQVSIGHADNPFYAISTKLRSR